MIIYLRIWSLNIFPHLDISRDSKSAHTHYSKSTSPSLSPWVSSLGAERPPVMGESKNHLAQRRERIPSPLAPLC